MRALSHQVLKRINAEIEARRAAGEDLPPPPKTAIAGPEYFGLNQIEVRAVCAEPRIAAELSFSCISKQAWWLRWHAGRCRTSVVSDRVCTCASSPLLESRYDGLSQPSRA